MKSGKRKVLLKTKGHPPNQLESNNVVNQEIPPFCRACKDFHEESTYPIFCQINEQGMSQTSNFLGNSRNYNHINNFGEAHPLSMDFLEDKIITRFGVRTKITIDNAKAFSST
jgi:hypothetical protein